MSQLAPVLIFVSFVVSGCSIDNKSNINKCDDGDHVACHNVAKSFFDMTSYLNDSYGKESEKRAKQAFKYYDNACYGGIIDACRTLSTMYDLGVGTVTNESAALRIDDMACGWGDEFSCYNTGMYYARLGDSPKTDMYLRKSCVLGFSGACLKLAQFYSRREDKGHIKDARELIIKSCDMNNSEACYIAGKMYYVGNIVRIDSAVAERYFGKSCDLGFIDGCKEYKRLIGKPKK